MFPAISELVFFVAVICISLYNVYSPRVQDGLTGCVLYMLSAFVSVAGIMQILNGNLSDNTIWILGWLFVARGVRNSYLCWRMKQYAHQ